MHLLRRQGLHAADRGLRLRAGLCRWMGGTILAAGLCVAPPQAAAQGSTDGAVYGSVLDPAGHPVAGVLIQLSPLRGAAVREAIARADGTFLLSHVAPGDYALTLTTYGFVTSRIEPLTVVLGETMAVRTRLRVSGGISAINVQPETAEDGSALVSSISLDELVLLPSRGARWQDFALTTDAVNPDENADGLISVHGLPATQNNTLIDGVDANQSFGSVPAGTGSDPAPDPDGDADSADETTGPSNGLARGRHAGVAYVFSQAAVREFRVSGQGYSAQSGHAAGGVVTTISREGTDQFHGSGFFLLRSQLLGATNPLSIATSYNNGVATNTLVKPHDLRENFGATLAGPVPGAPKVVFFEAFDMQRRGFPAISSPSDPNFYALTAIQTALLGTRGVTHAKVVAALNFLSSLTGSTPRRADQRINFARVDLKQKPQPSLMPALGLEYNLVRWTSPAALIDAPVVARGRASIGNSAGSLDSVLLRATNILSPRLLNQVRVSFTHDLQYETPQTPLPQEPAISPGGLAPEVILGPNGLLFGTPASLSQLAYPDERRFGVSDVFTVTLGHHTVEVGGDLALVRDLAATLANAAGTFRYDSGVTKGYAGGLVDFITDSTFNVNTIPNGGCPSITSATHLFCFRSFAQSFGGATTDFSTQESSAFAEDTWRLRARLSLHFGVRYEYTLLPFPVAPNPTLDHLFGARGASNIFPEDRNNFGPRAAVAWEPFGHGHGSLHLGYGVFFGRLPGATIRSALSNTGQASSVTSIRITPSAVTACPQVASQGFGYPCAFTSAPSGVVAATTSAMVFDRHFRLPVVQQGSLSLEHGLGGRGTISMTYVMNLDRQLPSSTDLNIAPSTQTGAFRLQGGTGAPGVFDGETFYLPVYTARVSTSFGPVTDIASSVNATYQGLTGAISAAPLSTLRLRAGYTWSKAIDFGQSQSATPRTNGQFDPFTNLYDKALSSLNYPWALHAVAILQTHSTEGPRWLRGAATGWQLAPIVSARAGRPYSFDLSGGTRLAGGHESINGSGGALYLPTVGRNTLRLPPTFNVDLRGGRAFEVGPRLRVRLSAEAFNLLNHRNISSVTQRAFLVGTAVGGVTPLVFQNAAAIAAEGLNTQPFGTPNAAATNLARERQIQLSLHLAF